MSGKNYPAPPPPQPQKRAAETVDEAQQAIKRFQYSVQEKAQVVQFYNEQKAKEAKFPYRLVVDHFQKVWPDRPVAKSTVAEWCGKQSDSIIREYEEALAQPQRAENLLKQKKLKEPAAPLLENALVRWIKSKEEQTHLHEIRPGPKPALNDEAIQAKAVELKHADVNGVLKIPLTLNFSLGWVRRFRERHGIRLGTRDGEPAASAREVQTTTRDRARAELVGFSLNDIYTAGEFGLYYNIGPKRTMSTAGVGRSQGGKRDRQRMSLLYLVNSNGADARLFGIGTTLTPSSFMTGLSNQNKPWDPKAAVNIPWYRTPSGFMRQNIFMDIASNINREMKQQNRKVVLLLDYRAGQHFGGDMQYSNIKIVTLPPNSAAPHTAGMINALKRLFRKHQIAHFLMCLEKGLPLNVTCRDALQMFARALKEMNPATYVNSFVNAGLLPTGRPAGFDDSGDQNEASRINQETMEVAELMAQLHKRIVDESGEMDRGRELTMRDYVADLDELESGDATLSASMQPQYAGELSTAQIISEMTESVALQGDESEKDPDAAIPPRQNVTVSEARQAWASLSLFLAQRPDTVPNTVADALDVFYMMFCKGTIRR